MDAPTLLRILTGVTLVWCACGAGLTATLVWKMWRDPTWPQRLRRL